MFSVYLYILIILIAVLIIFVVRQVRLRRAIARRRATREQQGAGRREE